jgi:hypothetical protein
VCQPGRDVPGFDFCRISVVSIPHVIDQVPEWKQQWVFSVLNDVYELMKDKFRRESIRRLCKPATLDQIDPIP